MKIYHMIVAKKDAEARGDTSTRREYQSAHQGAAPYGFVCVGVCGYHEKPAPVRTCIGCVYYNACGDTMRTEHCDGRTTKSMLKGAKNNA